MISLLVFHLKKKKKWLLSVAGVGGQPETWVYSEHRCKLEGTLNIKKDVVATTVILKVSDLQ